MPNAPNPIGVSHRLSTTRVIYKGTRIVKRGFWLKKWILIDSSLTNEEVTGRYQNRCMLASPYRKKSIMNDF